jgi:hypothetical protein
MATGKPAPKKQPSKASAGSDARKQTILKNLAGLNAKAVAAHKNYDGPVSADNLAKKAAIKKAAAKRLSNAEGNKNGYASKQSPSTSSMNTKKGSKPYGATSPENKTKSVDRNREDMNAKARRPKGGPGMAASKKK